MIRALTSAPSADPDMIQFITFEVGNDHFALPIQHVIEFRTWTEPTGMPHVPSYMRGVINVRGEIIPVFDLAARIGRGLTDATARHVTILAQNLDGQTTGVLVDSVLDILSVTADQISALPHIDGGDAAPFLSGVLTIDGALLGIIDIDRLVREAVTAVPIA